MLEFDDGRCRRINGHWQLYVRARPIEEDGTRGEWFPRTRMTDVACDKEGDPPRKVRALLRSWRDSMVAEDAVAAALGETGSDASRVADTVLSALGVNSDELDRPFIKTAERYFTITTRYAGSDGVGASGGSRDIYRLWVAPYLPGADSKPIRDMRPDDVHLMLERLARKGYSPSVILKAWGLVKAIFTFSVQIDGLHPNPCYGIRVKQKRRPRINNLTIVQADDLARGLAKMPCGPAVFAARIALSCGLRGEEIAGLQVSDVDPRSDRIDIHRVVALRSGIDGKRSYTLCAPKTEDSERVIPKNNEVVKAIDDRLSVLRLECAEAGTRLRSGVFMTGYADGRWRDPKNVGKQWATISDCLGLRGRLGKRVTLHDLRHTFATVFLARGGNIKDLQAILGHSSAMMTLDVYASSDLASRSRTMSMVGRDLGAVMPEASIAPLSEIFEFDRA